MLNKKSIFIQVILILLVSNHKAFSQEDAASFINKYKSHTKGNGVNGVKWKQNLCGYDPEFFKGLFETTLFQRISDFKRFLGAGTGGFAFLANYIASGDLTKTKFEVAIKIIPDNENKSSFDKNKILAFLTGKVYIDKFQHRIRCNQDGQMNESSRCINKFYEMQFSTIKYKKTENSFTVLVSRVGVSDLTGELFKNIIDTNYNTMQLLNLFWEMAEGSKNINAHQILHGDIKEGNMILIIDNNNNYHLEYIDLDLMLNPNDTFEFFNDPQAFFDEETSLDDIKVFKIPVTIDDPINLNESSYWFSAQLRYTFGYRAPWIATSTNSIKTSGKSKYIAIETEYLNDDNSIKSDKKEKVLDLYPYDKNFKEDTYAVVKTILKVFKVNKNLVETDNLALYNIIQFAESVVGLAAEGPESIPTTAEMYSKFTEIIISDVDKRVSLEGSIYLSNIHIKLFISLIHSLMVLKVNKLSIVMFILIYFEEVSKIYIPRRTAVNITEIDGENQLIYV